MPEGLATAAGEAIDLDAAEREFHRAMAAPEPDEPEHAAPPKRAPADPDAPYGRKVDGTPKKAHGGRPPTKPRVTESKPVTPPTPAKGKSVSVTDYTGPLGDFTTGLWMVMAAAPVPNEAVKVKLRAQAAILKDNQPGLCQGVNLMAQHNGTIRRGVEALTMGNAGWVLPAVMAVAPFAVQSAQIWKSDPADLAALAARTEKEWEEQFAAMREAMGLDQAEQLADLADEREAAMAA